MKHEKKLIFTKDLKVDFLLAIFVMCLILANILGTKIIDLFGIRVSFGIFFVPVMFLVTDIIAEVYGKKKATSFVYIGIFVMVVSLIMIYFSIIAPANITWGNQEAYSNIFSATLRMTFASIIAFMISQLHDVWSFDFIKKKTKDKYLWLRNNVSTIVSQFIDTTIFMFIAFYNISPKFSVGFIFSLIIPYWIFKIIFAILDTPLVYLGVWWLKKED
ncbi:MAG: queuosine precursor transporter [Candidatus Woesearchaeota archaeon]